MIRTVTLDKNEKPTAEQIKQIEEAKWTRTRQNMEEFKMEYVINFSWDNEANVWIATSDDVPGLVLESGSFDALLERTRFAVPEMLALNASETTPVSLTFLSKRCERMVY